MNVAIIGKGHCWWNFKDGSFDALWAINDIYRYIYLQRNNRQLVDMVFDIHDYEWTIEDCEKHYRKLKPDATDKEIKDLARFKVNMFKLKTKEINEHKIPLVSVRKYDFIPTSIKYPKKEVVEDVCHGRDYLHGTLAYALAYCLFCGWDATLFGCNLAGEYSYQESSVAYLIGVADERGIKIEVDRSGGSEILAADFNYGYIESYSP